MTAPTIMVIGSGRSAVEAAKEVVAQRGKAILVRSGDSRACALRIPSGIEVLDGAELVDLEGSTGRFAARLRWGGDEISVTADAVIVTDEQRQPEARSIGISLDDAGAGPSREVRSAAIVLGPSASRPHHLAAVRHAAALRSRSPPPEVTIFIRELLVRGEEEIEYAEAQRSGVRFVRTAELPSISESSLVTVKAIDLPSGIAVTVHPDLLITEGLLQETELPSDRALIRAGRGNISMGPAASTREGVLLCRPAERDLSEGDLVTEARAAATRAITLARSIGDRSSSVARVDRDRCSACLTCVRTCPFHAPHIDGEGKAAVTAELCQACGCCVAACPSRALSLPADEAWTKAMSLSQKVKP